MKRYYYKSLITGFCGVCAEGGFCDGFLNRCRDYKIPIRKVRYAEKCRIYFCVPCEFLEQTEKCAELSGMSITVRGVFGLVPFMKKHRDRAFLISGIILTVLFAAFMSGRVWSIKIIGNDKFFSSELLSACAELGLKTGVRKKKIDVASFQSELLEKTGGRLIWVSLNTEGMCAQLEVRETVIPEDDTIGKPCNYIADFDGIIKICRVYSGTAAVKRGNPVRKGDLLISGVTEYETGESSFTEARGKITAQHSVKIEEKAVKSLKVRKYGKNKHIYSLSLFGFEINPLRFMKKASVCEITRCTESLEINSTVLPFYFGEYTVTGYEECETNNEKMLSLITLESYLSRVGDSFKNSVVLSLSEKKTDAYSGKFTVIDEIGKKSVITLEETEKTVKSVLK